MAYATQADLETRFGADELAQLTDRVAGAVIDASVVARALDDASAEIDSYLASQYDLPLAAVPPVLVRVASDIARYYLWADRATEAVRQRYEDARIYLGKVAKGDARVGGDTPPPEESAGQEAFVTAPSRPRVFGGA